MQKKIPLVLVGAVAFLAGGTNADEKATRSKQVDLAVRVATKKHGDPTVHKLDDADAVAALIPDDGKAVVIVFEGGDKAIAEESRAAGAHVYEALPRGDSVALSHLFDVGAEAKKKHAARVQARGEPAVAAATARADEAAKEKAKTKVKVEDKPA